MGYWIINGKEYSEEEHAEYQEQEQKRWELDEAEVQRLISTVGEAYRACEKFMEEHPRYPYGMKDNAQQREFEIYQNLRSNLGAADRAPRCEKVREDGTRCGSPRMKGYQYCYAHERMLQTQSLNLELPALEDANGIQLAIMRVQKALIDDEITEKKAGLLLYSLQMASSNLKHTTFASKDKRDVVTEMPESPAASSSQTRTSRVIADIGANNTLPLMKTDKALSPQVNADRRRSEKQLPKLPGLPKPRELKTGNSLPLMNADQTDLR